MIKVKAHKHIQDVRETISNEEHLGPLGLELVLVLNNGSCSLESDLLTAAARHRVIDSGVTAHLRAVPNHNGCGLWVVSL